MCTITKKSSTLRPIAESDTSQSPTIAKSSAIEYSTERADVRTRPSSFNILDNEPNNARCKFCAEGAEDSINIRSILSPIFSLPGTGILYTFASIAFRIRNIPFAVNLPSRSTKLLNSFSDNLDPKLVITV